MIKKLIIIFISVGIYTCYASFTISPINIVFKKDARVESITLSNNHNETKSFQLSLYKVSGNSYPEKSVPSKDLLITPIMFDLKSGQKQIIRIAKKQRGQIIKEKYKLVVQELPKKRPKNGNYIHLITNFALPITFED